MAHEARAFYPDRNGELVEVVVTGYSSNGEVYITRADGGLLREKFFGFTTYTEVLLVPQSAVVVEPSIVRS